MTLDHRGLLPITSALKLLKCPGCPIWHAQHHIMHSHYSSYMRIDRASNAMAPKVVLRMTPSAGGCLAKTYTAEILQGRGHIALHVLGVEAAAGVESDVRKAFGLCKASKEGIMITTIKMRDVDDPVEKSLGTILEALRADDSKLVELDRNFRSLPVYVDFQSSSGAKGESFPRPKVMITWTCPGLKGLHWSAVRSQRTTARPGPPQAGIADSKAMAGQQGVQPLLNMYVVGSGETRGTRRKTNVVAANAGDAKPAADVFSKGVIGAHSLPASRKTPVAWHSVCNQV